MATVLAIDKDPVQLEFLTFLLSRQGHGVHSASAPEAAFDVLYRETVDLVIMDPVFPRQDGDKVCQQIRQLNPYALMFIVSERSGEDDIVNCLLTAADEYVSKPISPRQFLARVHALLRRGQLGGRRSPDEDIRLGEVFLSL